MTCRLFGAAVCLAGVCACASAQVERFKDEGLFLARIAELQTQIAPLDVVHEGCESTAWDGVRSTFVDPNAAPTIDSQGLTWAAAAAQLWGNPWGYPAPGMTTNTNWARSGNWGMYEFHSGSGYPTTIRLTAPRTMYAFGIWINTNPDGVDTGFLFEDRTTANDPGYVLPGIGAMYPGDNPGSGHTFIGIVDPAGFDDVILTGTLEVNEKGFLEGGAIYGADDAIVAILPLSCEGDANGDSVVDVNDISYVLFRLGDPCAAPGCDGDANGDGVIDVNDISYVLFRLGDPC